MNKNIELVIPTEMQDITLGKYLALRNFAKETDNDIETSIKLISLMCDISVKDVRALKNTDFNFIIEKLTEALNSKVNYVKPPNFKIGDIEYGFIPNLDEITFGEYIDIDTFIKDENDLHKVMTVLYRPVIAQSFGMYRIAEYSGEEDYDIMLDAPMDAVNSAMVFFYHLGTELLKATTTYLERVVKEDSVSQKVLEKNGVGIPHFTDSQAEMFKSLTPQHNYQFTKR